MNKTEKKILENALELYNKKGIDSITVRHIAADMEIRHSNITYYFPKKNDIIDVLYHKRQAELDAILDKFKPSENGAFELSLFSDVFDVLYKYRFVLINNGEIFKRLPDLKKIYHENNQQQRQAFASLGAHLQETGVFKLDISDDTIMMILLNITLVSDFWIVYCDLNEKDSFERAKNTYLKLILNSLLPIFTEKGLEGFNAKMKNLSKD